MIVNCHCCDRASSDLFMAVVEWASVLDCHVRQHDAPVEATRVREERVGGDEPERSIIIMADSCSERGLDEPDTLSAFRSFPRHRKTQCKSSLMSLYLAQQRNPSFIHMGRTQVDPNTQSVTRADRSTVVYSQHSIHRVSAALSYTRHHLWSACILFDSDTQVAKRWLKRF